MRRRLDALLGRKFKTTKFIATVNFAVSHITVLKNQRQARLEVARSDVIELLNLNHHEHALLRVDQVIKEQNMLDVFVMMEGYFHLLLQKVNLIEKQKDCPDELKEAVSSLLYAAPRCGEFPELQEVRGILTSRYGKEFAYGVIELRSNCGVNLKMIQKLSLRQSSLETRLKTLQDIAIENDVVLKLGDSSMVQDDLFLQEKEGGEESVEHVMDDEISEVLSFSESGKGKKKYRDVEDAAQAAFESAAYAAAAARAAVELSRLRSFDTDNPDSSNSLPRKVLDSSNEQSKLQMKNEETQAGETLETSDSDGFTPVEKMMACDVKWNVDEKIYLKEYDLSQLPDSPDCPSLVKLSLQVPDLTIIPPNFFELMPNLEVLDLSNTNIVSLPTSISSLKTLQKFFLKDCFALMELPTQIGMLSKLKLFDIKGTELMFIPKEMGKLQDLEVLRISLSQYAKDYIKIKSVNETVIPKNMISELKQLKELCINVPPEAEWWEEEVKHIQNELCDLENLETLRWFLPTNEVLQQFLLLERNHVPVYANLSNLMLTIGQHAQLTSCLPHDLEKKFQELKNCLKWVNAEGNADAISKIIASAEALFLSRHWTIEKLSTFNVSNMKYCLLAECNEMETLVEADGLSEDVEKRKTNGEKVGLELLQYLSIHHMMKLHSIWKGPIGEDSLSKLRILALHSCPQLTSIFTLTIAQNLSCLAQFTVEDCPKVISLVNSEYQKVKYPIFPSLEKIFILDLPELVNIFVGHIMLVKLTTILIYSCPQLQDLCDMELPHIEKIEGEVEWWKGLVYDKSQWENVFVPLKKRRDLVKQLSEATNSLKHFHDVLSQGNDEKKLSNLTDMREQVTTPDTRMEKGKELFLPPEETEDNESYGWSHSEALDMESQSDVFSAFTEVDRFSLSGQGFARSEDAIEGDVVENEEDRRRIKNWHKGDLLGRGSFGSVYEGINDSGLFFAVKEVSFLDQGSQGKQCILQLEQEISLLSQFQHDNIVRYLGTDKDDGKLYIFLELVSKGSLANLYRKYHLRDHQVSSFTRQILSGLSYLHDRNVVHRNIKCSNILVDANGSVKLADFGLAEVTKPNDIKSCKGTAFWMAPEVVNTKNGDGRAADIWSLGCTVLEMLTGQVPYFPLEMMAAMFRIGNGIPPPIPNTLSSEARDFIFQCLQVNPNDRPTAAQLLNHQFVQTPVSKGGKSNPRR